MVACHDKTVGGGELISRHPRLRFYMESRIMSGYHPE